MQHENVQTVVIGGGHGRVGVGDGQEGMAEACHQKVLCSRGAPGGEWRGVGVGGDQPRGSFVLRRGAEVDEGSVPARVGRGWAYGGGVSHSLGW